MRVIIGSGVKRAVRKQNGMRTRVWGLCVIFRSRGNDGCDTLDGCEYVSDRCMVTGKVLTEYIFLVGRKVYILCVRVVYGEKRFASACVTLRDICDIRLGQYSECERGNLT